MWKQEVIEDLSMKLNRVKEEYGEHVKPAVIIGDFDPDLWNETELFGHKIINAPTISGYTLGNVDYRIARMFEEV